MSNKKFLKMSLGILVILSALLLIACPKGVDEEIESMPPDDTGTKMTGETVDVTSKDTSEGWATQPVQEMKSGEIRKSDTGEGRDLEIVYFDFDKYNLRPDAVVSLQRNVAWLKANPTVKILIEGHCDERGTNEYNMALGLRRANSSRSFLISNGIDASRIQVISYGEERPVDPGHNEEAWAKNRRAEFVIQSR